MQLAILAPGSRGDVQPYVALGKGLKEAGHAVRIVTHENFRSLVTAEGLELWPLAGNVEDVVQSAEMRELLEKGKFLAILAAMRKHARRSAVQMAEAGLAAGRGADVVLGGMGALFIGHSLAQKLQRPFLQAYLLPFTPTRAYPSVMVPPSKVWPGGWFNYASHQLMRQTMWQAFRSADNVARREVLDLPAAPLGGPFNSRRDRTRPVLYGFSPAVLPRPDDWSPSIEVTGYWFLDPAEDWSPPPELVDFLRAGPPPIYIGFGSMSNRNPEATADLVLGALAQTNQRAIMLSGWGGLRKSDMPPSVLMIDSLPHTWLFPRMAAVVHHGGAGTTAAGLRAGVPAIVIPFFGDQPFWGRRIAELGVGPDPIPRKRLTTERLAKAIQLAVTDESLRQRAAHLGAKIQAEDGIARAAAVVQQFTDRVGA